MGAAPRYALRHAASCLGLSQLIVQSSSHNSILLQRLPARTFISMYQIVKAKFAAKNPSAGEQSLLERFTCLLDITNTDNFEHVWQTINDCDLDFDLAAERLLSRPAPLVSPRSVAGGSVAISIDTPSTPLRKSSTVPYVHPSIVPMSTTFPDSLVSPKRQCIELSSSTLASSSSTAIKQISTVGLETINQAQRLYSNLSSKIQADGLSNPQELACLEFNLICDTVSGKSADNGIVAELNKLGAFTNLQQLALSGQLWSFVPIRSFEFSGGVVRLPKFSNEANEAYHRRAWVSHYVKLNSFGLSLKLEYVPFALDEAPMFTEILIPFSCLTPSHPDGRMVTTPSLALNVNSQSDVRTDHAFSLMYSWKGKPKSSPSISLVSLNFFDSREAQTLQNHINALRKCHSPHALDILKLSQPVKTSELYSKLSLNFFSDPWYLARLLFDEQLVADLRVKEFCGRIDDAISPDSKFVLRLKYPTFLMPVMMRAKERMKLSSWCRDKSAIAKLFEQFLRRELIARVFPFLNSGVHPEQHSIHNFFETPSLYITSVLEDEITVVFYQNTQNCNMPKVMSQYLRFFLKECTSGNTLNNFDDHLACEGQRIMSRKVPIVPQGAVLANSANANTANSTSEWMNYLALTDADVAPECQVPSFFLQSLLPSQQQSLNFMFEIEKRPCSDHLYVKFAVDDQLATTEFRGKYPGPIQHAQYYSLCPINEARFVSSPTQLTGGLLCDPMGSGKTRVCIAMIAATLAVSRELTSSRSMEACNLILVPPNVLGHWIRELESCFGIQNLEKQGFHIGPNISIALVHGMSGSSKKHDFVSNTYDIVLTTYQTFNSRLNTACRYGYTSIPRKYHRVFCDEAHAFHSKGGIHHATFDSLWLVTGTPILLHGEDLNSLLGHFKLKMPKETFRSLLTTNLNLFGTERQKALAILKPIFVYHSPKATIGGVPVTCGVGSDISTVRIVASPREVQVYESFREILQRSRGIHAVLSKIIEGLRRSCSPRSFDPAAFLQIVTNLLNQVETRLREEPEYVPRMVEAKFVEKSLVQALEYVTSPFAKARIRELWQYLSNCEDTDPHECTVCMEIMKDPLITSCGHWFCAECVTGVLDSHLHICPICRTRTTNKNLIKLIGWQTQVQSAPSAQPVEETSKIEPPLDHVLPSLAVDPEMPSKLVYLRRKFLTWVRTDDKIVIFSEFQGCLNSVVELARSVGINAAVLNHSLSLKMRSSRIAEFQNSSSSLRLLAVSVATCGVGISLSAATQVIFTEPLISEALEKQCMARVCRWGQSRFCHMERLILSSSVEEMLLKKRDKIKKMINLVTSIRDISDSLPALSGGVSGSVVENEPDLAVFTRDVPERPSRSRIRVGIRRQRYNPWIGGGPARVLQDPYHEHHDYEFMGHLGPRGYSDSDDSDFSHNENYDDLW